MKTAVILSDTHGNLRAIEKILPIIKDVDYVFHLGDCFTDFTPFLRDIRGEFVCVKGNCDYASAEKTVIVNVEGRKIMLTHGDTFGVKQSTLKLSFVCP